MQKFNSHGEIAHTTLHLIWKFGIIQAPIWIL